MTDALGKINTYRFQTLLGVVKNTAIEGGACTSCGNAAVTSYDANDFLASRTDFNGNVIHDTRGLERSRTEASGTPQARTITTDWHPTFRLPTLISEPGKTTRYDYFPSGNRQTVTEKDTVTGETRTTRYTYTTAADNTLPNLLKTINGPRTDVADITTYGYDPQGNLIRITNAQGHVTLITSHDAHGRPLTTQDPNGLLTTLSYDPRGRLTSSTVGGERTQYDYDAVGQLIKITLPNQSFITYDYYAAHRLTDIRDNFNNHIHYTLDLLGNRTKEDSFDPSNTLTQTRSRIYDTLNRLRQDLGAEGQSTAYDYDTNGNLTLIDDPVNPASTQRYDALNRLVKVIDPKAGNTDYSYDAQDQLTQVTDPKRLITTYGYNTLGDVKTLASPDTGITQHTYDVAGNLKTSQDARGELTTHFYDKLDRLTRTTYADSSNTYFQYDVGANALGRLNKVTDSTGNSQWTYDLQGRVSSKTQVTGALSKTVDYDYDAQGNLLSTTYPSGKVIGYSYTQGRLSGMTVDGVPLLMNLQYQPFGPIKSWQWGNGSPFNRSFDLDGRLASQTLGTATRTLGYDDASRITSLTVPNNQSFGYDELDRLTHYTTTTTNQSYTYDPDGNRLTHTIGAIPSYTYSYPSTNNKLSNTTGPTARTYTYDAAGNISADGRNLFSYDARGRLKQVTYNTTSSNTYQLNGLGQRVRKSGTGVPTGSTVFMYDEAGQLL